MEAAEKEAQKAAARLSRIKNDYANGELTAAELREQRTELEPEGQDADAKVKRLKEQFASTETPGPLDQAANNAKRLCSCSSWR